MRTHVFESIQDIPAAHWNALSVHASITKSHEYWSVIEKGRLPGFHFRWVLFYDDAAGPDALPVAHTCIYTVGNDIAIFSSKWLRGVLTAIRRRWPNFLMLKMIECGTPITPTSPPFIHAPGVDSEALIAALDALLQRIGNQESCALIVVRDFEQDAQQFRPAFEKLGYFWCNNLPNTYIDIAWKTPEEYLASLKSYYRSKLLKHLRKFQEAGVRYEVCEDFAGLAPELIRQWMVVHDQADEYQRETLTREYYEGFGRLMGGKTRILLFYRGDVLIGHAQLLFDGEMLRWLYFGRNEAVNDSLYIFVSFSVIETAIRMGFKRIETGLTTYSIKQDLGARVEELNMALRTLYRPANGLVARLYPILNAMPKTSDRNVFRGDPPPRHGKRAPGRAPAPARKASLQKS